MNQTQYVLPSDDTWMVRDITGVEKSRFFSSMMDAIRYARTIALKCHSEVIVLDNDMNILSIASYAKNPY